MFSYNQYGFVMDGLNDFFKPDDRFSRCLNGPHHNVMLNTFSSQNRFLVKSTKVNFNYGFQSNSRMEDEGGGQISLNMHLFSLLQNMQLTFPQNNYGRSSLSYFVNQQLTFTNNKNYGGRVIVPDANMTEANLGGLVKFTRPYLVLDGGLGIAFKSFQTYQTRTLNSPGERIQPFAKNAVASNASVGFALTKINLFFFRMDVKGNLGTGFRPGNLAELSCNGLHEGSIRYELGNPNLKNETNVTSDFSIDLWSYKILEFKFSSYINQFNNYIYLAPTKDSFYGYQVFKYEQTNAKILGTETLVNFHIWKRLDWVNIWSRISGTKTTGSSNYLPFISPNKLTTRIVYFVSKKDKLLTISPEMVFVGEQLKTAEFETTTGAYKLFNLQIDYQILNKWNFSLTMRNLTNTVYFDHLSRLKAYNLYNQGRNFVITVRKAF
jgi:iron complex outermembrane receptor protein